MDRTQLQTITAYVPAVLVERVIDDPTMSLEGWQERVDVVLLFADVSGFTQMSETLACLGKEGAEELTRILNGYFTTMIDLVRAYGGFVLRFGGDALTCQFPEGAGGAKLAASCALAMQQRMADFANIRTEVGVFSLQMKIGISGGPALFLSVGRADRGLEYVLVGLPVERMVEAEHYASPGEVVIDTASAFFSDAMALQRSGIMSGEQRGDFRALISVSGAVGPSSSDKVVDGLRLESLTEQAVRQLVRFIPENVYEQIVAGHWGFLGDHRRVVTLFVNFAGLDYARDRAAGCQLQTYFVAMQNLIQRYGGRLNRVITGDKGNLLHVIFGAPVAYEDNERRAVRCALAMRDELSSNAALGFVTDQRMGLASGYVFAGNVGSARRQEYTVMGDVVNLSARLMQAAAPDDILMDEQTVRHVTDEFETEALPAISVKGKRSAVPTWRLLRPTKTTALPWSREGFDFASRYSPMVGRREELAVIEALLDKVQAGYGQLLDITGEAGVGKSRLFAEAFPRAVDRGFESWGGTCPSYGSQIPYLPWVTLFQSFFGLSGDDDAGTAIKLQQLTQWLITVDATWQDWVPLVAQFLGFSVPDTPLTSGLTPELRKQRLFDIVLTTLRVRSSLVPLVLTFEDLHSADAISLEMLAYVARNIGEYPILVVALHRSQLELSDWESYPFYHRIDLQDLPSAEVLALARARLGMDEIPEPLETVILRGETHVNPFFVEEVLNTLIDRHYLFPREAGPGYDLVRDLADVDIPDSIHTLVMSRIDRLDETSRMTLKVASVIGRTFSEGTLQSVYPVAITQAQLRDSMKRLSDVDLTLVDKPAPDWEYAFRHVITQEVAYESLLYAHRRELHHRVAAYFEMHYAQNLEEHYELLAYHYAESADVTKGWTYLVKAGDKAQLRYANEAAIAFYDRALALSASESGAPAVHASLADVHHLLGRYEPALDHYRAALDASQEPTKVAVLRRKIAKTWAVQGLYDGALNYLDLVRKTLNAKQDALELVRVYDDMGWIARQRGEYELALDSCLQSLTLIQSVDDAAQNDAVLSLRAHLLHNLGSIYGSLGDYETSIAYFKRCIEDSEARDDLYEAGRSYVNLAVVYWRLGNFDLVADYLGQSLKIFDRIGYTHGTAMCYNNLGVLHFTQDRYQEAIAAYQQSLQIRQEIGDQQGIADLHNNLGEVYAALSEYRQASQYLERAATMFVDLGDKATLVDTYRLLAEVELSLDDIDAALDYAKRSLSLAQAIGNAEYEGAAARILGKIYCEAQDLEESCRYLEESLRVLAQTENRLEIAQSRLQLGRALLTVDAAAAARELHLAIDLFLELGLEGDVDVAQEYLRQATQN